MKNAETFQVLEFNVLQKTYHFAIGESALHLRSKSSGGQAGGKHSAFCILHSAFSRGFTLVEVLLVVVIMGVIMTIAMPSFVRSIQAQRLGTAARTISTVARYARSMAVLKQSDLALAFNLANGQVDLVASNTSLPNFSRAISGVRLHAVAIDGADPVTEGVCSVPFLRNGVCVPFAVTIVDQNGNNIVLKVDALGSVKSKVFGTQ